MKLSQLTAKPQLSKIVLDDEEVIAEYNEPIEFYVYDRQPLENYIKMANIKQDSLEEMITAVKSMILDEDGKTILREEMTLPNKILTKVVMKVVENMGK